MEEKTKKLIRACAQNDLVRVRRLLRGSGIAPNLNLCIEGVLSGNSNYSAIEAAAVHGSGALISMLVHAGALMDNCTGQQTVLYNSPLKLACRYRNVAAVSALLDSGALVDGPVGDLMGFSALHCACKSGCVEACALLLQAGADPNASDYLGRIPGSSFARTVTHSEKQRIAQLLEEARAERISQDEERIARSREQRLSVDFTLGSDPRWTLVVARNLWEFTCCFFKNLNHLFGFEIPTFQSPILSSPSDPDIPVNSIPYTSRLMPYVVFFLLLWGMLGGPPGEVHNPGAMIMVAVLLGHQISALILEELGHLRRLWLSCKLAVLQCNPFIAVLQSLSKTDAYHHVEQRAHNPGALTWTRVHSTWCFALFAILLSITEALKYLAIILLNNYVSRAGELLDNIISSYEDFGLVVAYALFWAFRLKYTWLFVARFLLYMCCLFLISRCSSSFNMLKFVSIFSLVFFCVLGGTIFYSVDTLITSLIHLTQSRIPLDGRRSVTILEVILPAVLIYFQVTVQAYVLNQILESFPNSSGGENLSAHILKIGINAFLIPLKNNPGIHICFLWNIGKFLLKLKKQGSEKISFAENITIVSESVGDEEMMPSTLLTVINESEKKENGRLAYKDTSPDLSQTNVPGGKRLKRLRPLEGKPKTQSKRVQSRSVKQRIVHYSCENDDMSSCVRLEKVIEIKQNQQVIGMNEGTDEEDQGLEIEKAEERKALPSLQEEDETPADVLVIGEAVRDVDDGVGSMPSFFSMPLPPPQFSFVEEPECTNKPKMDTQFLRLDSNRQAGFAATLTTVIVANLIFVYFYKRGPSSQQGTAGVQRQRENSYSRRRRRRRRENLAHTRRRIVDVLADPSGNNDEGESQMHAEIQGDGTSEEEPPSHAPDPNRNAVVAQHVNETFPRIEYQQMSPRSDQADETVLCDICMENRKDSCLIPCGHLFCNVCAAGITDQCFICKQVVENVQRIFL